LDIIMEKVYEDSLEFHKKHHGVLEIKSKVPIKSREDLAIVYTPGVAEVSRQIGTDKALAKEYTIKKNTVAVISDGSAILGLGNLGPYAAIPVMEGKAAIFKEFAGIDAFPICLDTQDSEEIIKVVKQIAPVFGAINLEDISAPRCFGILARLKEELDIPVVHDDQQGTAVVVLAASINALKLKKMTKTEAKVVINGAGAAGIAIAKLFLKYGFTNLVLCDSSGAIYQGRSDLNPNKTELANLTNIACQGGLDSSNCVIGGTFACATKLDIFIGVSKGNIVTPEMVKEMNPDPAIFAMANPIPEIMPDIAKKAGAFIVGTGRSDFPNQINNALVFPGIFRGALDNKVINITDEMLINAAENLAGYVKDLSPDHILPEILDKNVVKIVAEAIKESGD